MWELYEKWVWETGGYVPRKTVLREMASYRLWLAGARYMKEMCVQSAETCAEKAPYWSDEQATCDRCADAIRSINTEE